MTVVTKNTFKVVVQRDQFKQAIDDAGLAVAKRASLPVIECVLLEVKDGETRLRLVGNDLEKSAVTYCSAQIHGHGAIAVPFSVLKGLIAEHRDPVLTLFVEGDEDDELVIKAENSTLTVKSIAASQFPLPDSPPEYRGSIPAGKLYDLLRGVTPAAATDLSRPILTGVLMRFNGVVEAVAADGFRLAHARTEGGKFSDEFSFIVPATALIELNKILKRVKADVPVEVRTGKFVSTDMFGDNTGGMAAFQVDDFTLTTRLVAGKYPDFTQIVPKDGANVEATFVADEFNQAGRLVKVFDPMLYIILRFTNRLDGDIETNLVELSVESTALGTGSDSRVVLKDIKSYNITPPGGCEYINLSAKYVGDAMVAMNGHDVVVGANSKVLPAKFTRVAKNEGEAELVWVIMPMHRS